MTTKRRRSADLTVSILLLSILQFTSTSASTCTTPPTGIPDGFSLKDTTDNSVKFIVVTESRKKIANLVCFHSKWFMSMDPTTGRFPNFEDTIKTKRSLSNRYRQSYVTKASPRRSSPRSRQLSPRKLANYCRKNVCQNCQQRTPIRQVNTQECEVRSEHFTEVRSRLLRTQNDYGNCTSKMQKQAYDLKLCNYKQRRADTLYDNAKDTIGTYKQKMFSMKSRINELTDELTSTTSEFHQLKADFTDTLTNHQFDLDEQHEQYNLMIQEEQQKCGSQLMDLEDRIQQADWDLQEEQAKLEDQMSSTSYYRQNYEWCRNQLNGYD